MARFFNVVGRSLNLGTVLNGVGAMEEGQNEQSVVVLCRSTTTSAEFGLSPTAAASAATPGPLIAEFFACKYALAGPRSGKSELHGTCTECLRE